MSTIDNPCYLTNFKLSSPYLIISVVRVKYCEILARVTVQEIIDFILTQSSKRRVRFASPFPDVVNSEEQEGRQYHDKTENDSE